MPVISSIVSSVVNIFTKILPLLFAYKADKIEEDIERLSNDSVVSKLRNRWGRKDLL